MDSALPTVTAAPAPLPRTSRSLLWSVVETFGATAASVLAVIVLARVLSVEAMGLGSLAVLIAYLASLPFEVLFHDTLVQRPALDDAHASSAFVFTATASLLCAAAVFACAPAIAAWYGQPQLAGLLRLALVSAPLAGMSSVVSALLRRRLAFAPLARRTIVGRLIGVAAGVAVAFAGGGAWSMVVMQVASTAISTAVLLGDRSHVPRLAFSWRAIRQMLGFALPNMAAQLLQVGNARLFLGVFGLFADTATFGRFSLAFRLVEELRNSLSASVTQLALPLLARQAGDATGFARVFRESTRFTVSVMLPLYAGFGLLAPDVVALLFGAKWHGTEVIIQWLCVATLVLIVREFAGAVLTARGAAGTTMTINGIAAIVSMLPLAAGLVSGGVSAAAVWLVRAVALWVASLVGVRRSAGLTLAQQLGPTLPALAGVAAMAGVVLVVLPPWLVDATPALHLAIDAAGAAVAYLLTLALVARRLLPDMLGFVASAGRRGTQPR